MPKSLYKCAECEYFGIMHFISKRSEECHDTEWKGEYNG
jgi:hypothetical protein